MGVSRAAASFLVIGLLGTLMAGCGGGSEASEEPEYKLVPVQRGDLTVEVTSTGNLVYSHEEELTFGVGGTIGEVLVEEDAIVEEGQVLARLDAASTLTLEQAVAQARITLTNAEDSLEEARHPSGVAAAAANVAQAELAVVNARLAVETAQEGFEKAIDPYTEVDIIQAELAVISAEVALENAQDAYDMAKDRYESNWTVPEWIRAYEQTQRQLAIAEFGLAEAEETVAEMLAGSDPLQVEQRQKQLAAAEASLAAAEEALIEAQEDAASLSSDSLVVVLRRAELATAQAVLEQAVENLDMDTIAAPFAGIVTSLVMEEGQAVNAASVIVLTDPIKFEASMLVNEVDVFNVRVGALASVEIDALPGFTLPATVTSVSLSAAPQQGVVNYRVKAELASLAAAAEVESPQEEVEPVASIDEVLEKAVVDERLTQEQADMLRERLAQAGAKITSEQLETLIERFSQSGRDSAREPLAGLFQKGSAKGQFATGVSPDDLQLREGLSVTVSIIIDQRINVLLVPNQAIQLQDGMTYVEVVQDGQIRALPVVTGLSDWQYTEAVEGLSEGEEVVIWQTAGSSTTTETEKQRSGFQMLPGAGRFAK